MNEVRNRINAEGLNFQVLESKNVSDVLICKQSELLPVLIFIEVKLYKVSSGRIGIGQGGEGKKGEGFQPEILMSRPIYFDRYLRWVICNEDGECVFASSEVVTKHLAGDGVTKGKQNNISSSIFKEQTIDISGIADEIVNWLKIV